MGGDSNLSGTAASDRAVPGSERPPRRRIPPGGVVDRLRFRAWWSAAGRRVLSDHRKQMESTLRSLRDSPITSIELGRISARFDLDSALIVLAGIQPTITQSLRQLGSQSLYLTNAGRYGQYWWMQITSLETEKSVVVVALGTHIRISRSFPGSDGHLSAAVPPLVSARR